jgi:hypothetical protein
MKSHVILSASLALAFAAPAFAQDSQTTAAPQADDQQAPADAQQTAPAKHHHRIKHQPMGQYSPAAMALTGDDAKTAAYQASGRQKAYPAVDHGHVPGDPPIIDHSGDQMAVAPTSTTITVPPSSR